MTAVGSAPRDAASVLLLRDGEAGIEVLFDERNERPGVIFADLDLIGIPHRLVLGEKGLAKGAAEYKGRRDKDPRDIPLEQVVTELARLLGRAH